MGRKVPDPWRGIIRPSEDSFVPRPLVQHPHALADHQPDARPALGSALEDAARLVEVVAGVEHECSTRSPSRLHCSEGAAKKRTSSSLRAWGPLSAKLFAERHRGVGGWEDAAQRAL